MASKSKTSPKLDEWIHVRRRCRLSHAQIQMARELGMNPRKLPSLDNHQQQPWKLPLPQFIETLYEKSFGRRRPDVVMSIEDHARVLARKKAARKAAKAARKAAAADAADTPEPGPTATEDA